MAFLNLDENNMFLKVVLNANESYIPDEKSKAIQEKVDSVRARMIDFQKKEKEFMAELAPIITEIRSKVLEMNEAAYPELKTLREQRESTERLQ